MAKQRDNNENPKIHKELRGYNIHIDEFGQVKTTFTQEQLNTFLNKKVADKKFSARVRRQLGSLYKEEE